MTLSENQHDTIMLRTRLILVMFPFSILVKIRRVFVKNITGVSSSMFLNVKIFMRRQGCGCTFINIFAI